MRTKTLILSAMIGVAGIASSFAQNVYSVNVVGYINLTLTANFTMVANQLDNLNNNLVVDLIPDPPVGTVVSKYTGGGGYANLTRIKIGTNPASWQGATTMTLAPGEGVFIKKPTSVTSMTLTFVGEVQQGDLSNPVAAGFDIYGCQVPQAGLLQTLHGYAPEVGDVVSKYLPAGGYANLSYVKIGTQAPKWLPNEPDIAIGEAFWIKSVSTKPWTRTFHVNP